MALFERAVVALMVIAGLSSAATGANYTVGGDDGWTFQSSNTLYSDQFANISLFVGDILFFPYSAPAHNVYEIPQADLASCSFDNTIAAYTSSNAVVTLNSTGVHAFACEVPGHCTQGMVLSVTVLATAPTAAPSTPPVAPPAVAPAPTVIPPAPSTTPTRAPSPATTPPTTPPIIEVPAPAPASEENAGSNLSSGSAMVLAAFIAGFAFFLV